MNNPQILASKLLALSVSPDWETARQEWELIEVHFDHNGTICLCTHSPIIEVCTLQNKHNSNLAMVGNCCVKKFIRLPSNLIFSAIKRIRAKDSAAINGVTLEYLTAKEMLTEWEREFYYKTLRKTKLSAAQRKKRIEINKKILRQVEATAWKNSTV